MLTTSVTTAAAFGMTAVIKIPTVRYFAVFCSVMVAVNFALVCTLDLAALILWDRYLRHMGGATHAGSSARRTVAAQSATWKPEANAT